MSSVGVPVQARTPSAKSDGGDVETAWLTYSHWEARGYTDGSAANRELAMANLSRYSGLLRYPRTFTCPENKWNLKGETSCSNIC
jgi:hypothetical protein